LVETKYQFNSRLNKILINMYPSKSNKEGSTSTPFTGTILPGMPDGRTAWVEMAESDGSSKLKVMVG
jgi:hypothetical protein